MASEAAYSSFPISWYLRQLFSWGKQQSKLGSISSYSKGRLTGPVLQFMLK